PALAPARWLFRRMAGRARPGPHRQLSVDVVRRHGPGRARRVDQPADPRSPDGRLSWRARPALSSPAVDIAQRAPTRARQNRHAPLPRRTVVSDDARMPTQRADAAARRAQILDAADAVFGQHGVTAPLDLVVERAQVGRAT